MGSITGLERSPGGGNGNPLQYSCLKNPMDRAAWRATVQPAAKSWMQLSNGAPSKDNLLHSTGSLLRALW